MNYLWRGIRSAFMPQAKAGRGFIHLLATIAGVIGCVRLTWGAPLWQSIVVYVAFFFIAHVACIPFTTMWAVFIDAADRWMRAVIEEELMLFDMRTYQRQLARVFPEQSVIEKTDH